MHGSQISCAFVYKYARFKNSWEELQSTCILLTRLCKVNNELYRTIVSMYKNAEWSAHVQMLQFFASWCYKELVGCQAKRQMLFNNLMQSTIKSNMISDCKVCISGMYISMRLVLCAYYVCYTY